MLQIPFISTIIGSHSDHSVSNALGEHGGERASKRASEHERAWRKSWRVGEGRYRDQRERKNFLLTQVTVFLGVSINLNLEIVMCSFPPFPVSLHFIPAAGYVLWMMISLLLYFDVIHFHPLPSFCPPFLSVFVLSVNVLDGGLSPGKHHYSHFLCNVNDGDPLFISDLLITPQSIAYPSRQGSHSHSRHYFIKWARLQRAVMNNALIMQVQCMQWLSSLSEKRTRWISLLHWSKLLDSLLARKGQDAAHKLSKEFLYKSCNFVEQSARSAT